MASHSFSDRRLLLLALALAASILAAAVLAPADRALRLLYVVPLGAGLLGAVALLLMQRRRAVDQLTSSELDLATTLESIADAVIATDLAGRITRMNPAAERATGWSLTDGRGLPLHDIFKVEGLLEQGGVLTDKAGHKRPIAGSTSPMRKGGGQITGAVLVFRDITREREAESARERAQREAREALEHLALILAGCPLATVMVDASGNIKYTNAAADGLFGYQAGELCGQPMTVLVPTENKRKGAPLLDSEALPAHLHVNRRKDGSRVPIRWHNTLLRDESGAVIGGLGMGEDITLELRTAGELRESEERYRTLVEHAPEAIVVIDLDSGRLVDANANAERLFGLPRSELLARDPLSLSPPVQADGSSTSVLGGQHLRAAAAGGTPEFEWGHLRADGTVVPCEVRLVKLPAEGRTLVRGSIIDVSERHNLEAMRRRSAELVEQNRMMHAANQLKNDFLANMSHELRTPLNAVIGFAELMVDGRTGPLLPDQLEYVGDILASGRHLLGLINDVLDLAKVESGKMEFHPTPVLLTTLVDEVTGVLRALVTTRRIQLSTGVDPALGRVITDGVKLKQVLYNYLSNAVKFTPDGGSVALRLRAAEPGFFRIDVEDSGIGIRTEDQGKLFVEFKQLDSGPGKKYAGTGLGLVLTKRIVEAQGGRVELKSSHGKGSIFSAILPRIPLPVAPRHPTPMVSAAVMRSGPPRLLVIEDQAADGTLIERSLTAAGYLVEVVSTGATALARCRERRYDAITLDLLLPDVGGLDVLRALREGGLNQDVPVIVISVIAERAAVAGFAVHEVLGKPVETDKLLRSLRSAGVTADQRLAWKSALGGHDAR